MTTQVSGSIRFNTDTLKMEIYRGTEWYEIDAAILGEQVGGGRGLFIGGHDHPSPPYDRIDFVAIPSKSNGVDFGDLLSASTQSGAVSSRTRAVTHRGASPGSNVLESIEIMSTGNSVDFGDMANSNAGTQGNVSNNTRGIFVGGKTPAGAETNVIEYITISTHGNAADFGDYIAGTRNLFGYGNAIRGVWGGGEAGPAMTDDIGYIDYTSLGNAVFFGDLTQVREVGSGASSPTRVLMMGGYINPGTNTNSCEYVQIMTTGNSKEFGDLNVAGRGGAGTSNSIRAITGGSHDNGNEIQSVEMSTTGNFVDFGDLTIGRSSLSAASNAHGGLG